MSRAPATIYSPLYLLESSEDCYRCGKPQTVVALAASCVNDFDEGPIETEENSEEEEGNDSGFLLLNIREMPEAIFALMSGANSRYRLPQSRKPGTEYYANFCECGANFGDFYLFSEPGHAFFPMSPEEAGKIGIAKLPIRGRFELRCGWEVAGGELIFKHGLRH
jgi:hypothetical protein